MLRIFPEAWLATGIVLGLLAMGALLLIPYDTAESLGLMLIGVGFAVGVPTGVVYHVQLYRKLAPRGELPRGWIWNPIRYHHFLRRHERFAVLSWCYTGAAGFVVIVLGMMVYIAGLVSLVAGA